MPVSIRVRCMTETGESTSPQWLVRELNRKLASKDAVISRTQGRYQAEGDYQLLNISARTVTYLRLSDLRSLAREMGILK
jgi:hypothetical protein